MLGRGRLFGSLTATPLGQAVPGEIRYEGTWTANPASCREKNWQVFGDGKLCCVPSADDKAWRCQDVTAPRGPGYTPAGSSSASSGVADTCLRSLQLYLVETQGLPYPSATGQWNQATERALAFRFPNPRAYPGGPCAMLTLLNISPNQPLAPSRAGMNFGLPSDISPVAVGLVAAVVLAAVLATRRAA